MNIKHSTFMALTSVISDEYKAQHLHGPDFSDISWLECVQSRDSSVESRDCFSEIIFTLVFDRLSCCRGFIRYSFIGSYHLHNSQCEKTVVLNSSYTYRNYTTAFTTVSVRILSS